MKHPNIPQVIYLYNEGIKGVDFKALTDFISKRFGKIKVRTIKLKEKVVHTRGLLFDFIATQKNFNNLPQSQYKDTCHIILTEKLFATCAEDKKIHLRAAIFSYPSVISLSGIVEAPAKPKEYYLYKQKYTELRIWEREMEAVKRKFKGRFIDYGDKRLTEILKGYLSQALFFHIKGEPFCKKRCCRLYNAHWQEELIYSQVESGEFCSQHKNLLKKIKILLDIG